ncbi:MAG: hypothetical protein RJB43_1283, partial [Verrucomicrobiota bacterium]
MLSTRLTVAFLLGMSTLAGLAQSPPPPPAAQK